jgi:hypothetical protein
MNFKSWPQCNTKKKNNNNNKNSSETCYFGVAESPMHKENDLTVIEG